jgi:hypothetical protein
MRYVILTLGLFSLVVSLLLGCSSAETADMSGGDSDADSDSDSDSDTDSGIPIQYPEVFNALGNPNSVMTGPISPPPENFFEAAKHPDGDEEDPDAGADDEELDEDDF